MPFISLVMILFGTYFLNRESLRSKKNSTPFTVEQRYPFSLYFKDRWTLSVVLTRALGLSYLLLEWEVVFLSKRRMASWPFWEGGFGVDLLFENVFWKVSFGHIRWQNNNNDLFNETNSIKYKIIIIIFI